jgi:RimJ/RimL family protein N-acetyltransferase
MAIDTPLYIAEDICLSTIDHEKDPEIESRWTHDSEYQRLLQRDPALPQSPAQLKKRYEKIEKDAEENHNNYYYTIRLKSDERLVGFAELYWIDWSNGGAGLRLGIGDPADRRKGYGEQALRLLVNIAFNELNLYRLTASLAEFNAAALALFCKHGFLEEVRQREAINRYGRRWDHLHLGLLREEWRP